MRLSNYFLPLLKDSPSDAVVISHKLMLRAGLISQISSGIYCWLPFGLKVLRNIENIIRKNLDNIGCQEILMSTLQPANLWIESGRYDSYGKEMLRIKDRHDHDLLYSPTNEEVVTHLFKKHGKSYKEMPKNLYQINWKFRDEIRPRFGVMRGREFLMMDAYSFDISVEAAKENYDQYYQAYLKIFQDMGLVAIPSRANTGQIGGDLSHEFLVLADSGESKVYFDKNFNQYIEKLQNGKSLSSDEVKNMRKLYAKADEEHNESDVPAGVEIEQRKAIEVGHIFNFGTKYSKAFKLEFADSSGDVIFPEMGSYGIGVSRLVAAMIEANHDDRGMIWHPSIAPFAVHLVNIHTNNQEVTKFADGVYQKLSNAGISVLYDDTSNSTGSKLSTADLLGMPIQAIISQKTMDDSQKIEVCMRKNAKGKTLISFEELVNMIDKTNH